MHIYHVASGAPVAVILRPARTPKGSEVCTVVKHVTKRLRRHWPKTRIVWRGDSHYGRVEAPSRQSGVTDLSDQGRRDAVAWNVRLSLVVPNKQKRSFG
jgi:hypothetical protein